MVPPVRFRLHATDRTFLVFIRWDEWYFRIAGRGIGLRNHERIRPMFSERNRIGPNRYFHFGPRCLVLFLGGARGH